MPITLGRQQQPLHIPDTIPVRSGVVSVRRAAVQDAVTVGPLIRDTFSQWEAVDIHMQAARETDPQVGTYLDDGGLIFSAAADPNQLIGTITLLWSSLEFVATTNEWAIAVQDGLSVRYSNSLSPESSPHGTMSLILLKRFAIHPHYARSGMGRHILDTIERQVTAAGFHGLLAATVEDARWLYDWYVKLGFQAVGVRQYADRPQRRVLLLKLFSAPDC